MTDESQFEDYDVERREGFQFYGIVNMMQSDSGTSINLDVASFKDRLSKCDRDNPNIERLDKLMLDVNSLEGLMDKIGAINESLYEEMGQSYHYKCADLMGLEHIYFQIVAMSPAPIVCTSSSEYDLLECLNEDFEYIGSKSIQWVLKGNENILTGTFSNGTTRGEQLFNTAAYYGCAETMNYLFNMGVSVNPKIARFNEVSRMFVEKMLLTKEAEMGLGLGETCYSL